jgi:glucose 1-dehydrogenase
MTSPTPLSGQKAIVTGGSSGIGAAICRAYGAAGAAVGINYRSKPEDAEAMAADIRKAGGEAIALNADISRQEDVVAMFDRFDREFGRVDIVVANAGIQKDKAFVDMELDDWNRVLEVNLTGQFLCAREGVRRFLAQDRSPVSKALGKIICMSSVHEVIPWAGHVNYAASKGGVMLMMKSLAQEVAPRKIRVNSIAPGAIRTPINGAAWETEKALRSLLELIPYGRIGEPDDVAKVAVWLASDEADYVTGTTIFVDGGMCLYPGFADNG